MKKIISIFILVCLSLSVFSACSKPVIPDEGDDTDLDFMGSQIKIYLDIYMGQVIKKGGSASSDREYDRMIDTQNKFNLVFDYVRVENTANTFLAGALSGGLQADLLKEDPLGIYEAYAIDTLIPVENIVNNPESDKWKTAGQNGCGIFNGKKYGVFPYLWETPPGLSGFINLNLTVMNEYGIPDPHDIIEAGDWDWTHFREFLTQTTFTDGDLEWKGLGNLAPSGECMIPFILGNGGNYMIYDGGKYKLAIDSDESIEAMQFAQSLVADKLLYDIPTDDEGFGNGKTWMIWAGFIDTSKEYELSYIRYPYGPHGNKDIVTAISHGDVMYAFPIFTAYSEEEIGRVVEYMFEPLSDLYPNGWKDLYEDTVFLYPEDYEYYLRGAQEAIYLDDAALSKSYADFRAAARSVFLGTISAESAIESVKDIIQADIDEHYNK